jgi:prepilin-type processing-associated H-X9-DG protein
MFISANRPGQFRFLDLVAVAVMLLVLAAVGLPAIQKTREADARQQCRKNLQRIAIALNDHDAQLTFLPRPAGTPTSPGSSVLVQLGPYMEADALMAKSQDVPDLNCPSDAGFVAGKGGTSYGVNIRGMNNFGSPAEGYFTLAQIRAGTSNVIAGGDLSQAGTYLYAAPCTSVGTTAEGEFNGYYGGRLTGTTKTGPGSNATAVDGSNAKAPLFSSYHAGGSVNIALFDGHVVQTNVQGAYKTGAPSGTGVIGACHPGAGNDTGIWAKDLPSDDSIDAPTGGDSSSSSEKSDSSGSSPPILAWLVIGVGAIGMIGVIVILLVLMMRRGGGSDDDDDEEEDDDDDEDDDEEVRRRPAKKKRRSTR